MNILKTILFFLVHSPFYPHWLNNRKFAQLELKMIHYLSGDVLEVGAGDASRKVKTLRINKKINSYLATDHNSWDDEFERIDESVSKINGLNSIFFGFQKRGKIDRVCDAMKLPFKNRKFDFHVSYEVLEHISDPEQYFKESIRVLKKGGKIIISTPVLYRVHGVGTKHEFDYYRYMPGFYLYISKKYNLKIEKFLFNTGYGTTFAQLTNQFMIESIKKSGSVAKLFLLSVSPFLFFLTNLLGMILDLKPDMRFSNRYFVVFCKQGMTKH